MSVGARRAWLGAGAALVATLCHLRVSQSVGRLRFDITYDDIAYVNEAVRRLDVLLQGGLAALMRNLVAEPPHSPFSTLLSMAALLVGGYGDLAFYALNGLVLVAATVFLLRQFPQAPGWVLAWMAAAFLLSPFAFAVVENFRPDLALGLVGAAMAWWFCKGLLEGEARHFRYAGIAFGAALWVKPTFFAHTCTLALGLALMPPLLARIPPLARLQAAPVPWTAGLRFLLLGLAIAAPYFAAGGREIAEYFWTNTRGEQSDLWSLPADTSMAQRVFIFVFKQYQGNIKFHLALAAGLIVLGNLQLLRQRQPLPQRQVLLAALLLSVAAASFVILVVGRHRNPYFFATFQSLMLLAAFHSVAAAVGTLQAGGRRAAAACCWVLLALTVAANQARMRPSPQQDSLRGASWNDRIVDQIAGAGTRDGTAQPRVLVPVLGPVNAHAIYWSGVKKQIRLETTDLNEGRVSRQPLQEFLAAAQDADFVVVPRIGHADYYRHFPVSQMLPAFSAAMLADPRFAPVVPPAPDARYFVLRNTRRAQVALAADRAGGHAAAGQAP